MRTLIPLLAALLGAAATAQTLQGHYRFLDDETVIELLPCGTATCGRVRGLPPKPAPDEPPPRCGQDVLLGFKPQGASADAWEGEALDPASNKRYRARLQAGQGGELLLVVSAFGGLVTESMRLAPAKDFKRCD